MKFYVEIKEGKNKKTYPALFADLEYTQKMVSFDRNVIAELCDITLRKLDSMQIGEKIEL